MIYKQTIAAGLAVFLFFSAANAQKAEMTISLNEAFFEALLDSVFQNFEPPEFSLTDGEPTSGCSESIRILREGNRVRTAVRFRGDVVALPLAFSGKYSLPFVGCVDFAGTADGLISLEFDRENQRLMGMARVTSVNLAGTNGIGGTQVAKLVQRSIDRKLNPIEIVNMEKLSFGFPVQNKGNLRMRALSARPEVGVGVINIRIDYEFIKG